MYELIITEKPKSALRIASSLAENYVVKHSSGGVPYYELSRDGRKIIVACAVGHLFGLGEIKGKNEVSKKDKEMEDKKSNEEIKEQKDKSSYNYPVFDVEWKPKVGFSRKYAAVLKDLAKAADSFIVACDYDIEGEVIGLNVLRFLCGQKDARRMKFSTLTKQEIVKAYQNTSSSINWPQAIAGETRHYLDWMYGVNFSRALIRVIKKNGRYMLLSIGRVQGPALDILAKRELEILAFKSVPYWQIFLLVKNSHEIQVVFPENIFDKKEAEKFKDLSGKKGIAKTEKETKVMQPLPPFDLTTLQVEAFRALGFTPSQTLQLAQNLYLAGLISYPRTSSQKLPPAIGHKFILERLEKFFPQLVRHVARSKPIEGKATDPAHPSIFPTGETGKLSEEERKLYELIVRRFIACFSIDAVVENKRIRVTVDGKDFFTKGLQIKEKGWMSVYPVKLVEKELPDLNGQVTVKSVNIEEKETQPPKRYSAAGIVAELTNHKLGTKGTRANIVDTLYKRGYIKDKQIVTTPLGLAVDKALKKYCPLILDENLTREFEDKLESLMEKTKDFEKDERKIINDAKKVIEKISQQFKKHETDIGKTLLEAYQIVRQEEKESRVLVLCSNCKKGMLRIITSKKSGKRFVACSAYPECKTTFPLPQQGLLKKASSNCEKCASPLLLLIRKGRQPRKFCFEGCTAFASKTQNDSYNKDKNTGDKNSKDKS